MEEVVGVDQSVKEVGYKDLLSETEFLKLGIAKIISRFGDSIDMVAYGWLVYQITGSATMLALIYAVSGIPSVVFNLISGAVVTYMQKKTVVYICDFARGVIVSVTALLFITGNLVTWHLFLFAFLNSTFEAFRDPAAMPLMMRVIPKEKLNHAVAGVDSASTGAELIGYSVAGMLIGVVGIGAVILIDALTFFISGILICCLKLEREKLQKDKLTVGTYMRDLAQGASYVWSSKLIFSICIFAGIFNFFVVPFNAMQPAYVDEVLMKGPEAISIMSVAFLIAMLVGGILSPRVRQKVSGKKMFIISGFLVALGYFGLSQLGRVATSEYIYIYLSISCVLMGVAVPMLMLPIKTGLMTQVEEQYLPRVAGFVNALALSTTPLGGAIVGGIVLYVPLQYTFMLFSIGIGIVFIVQCFNKSLSKL